jgi:hypothetical protein
MDSPTSSEVPQFATAEYSAGAPAPLCKACGGKVDGPHFQINGATVCPGCTQQFKAQQPADSHAAFVRATLFGAGGAVLGFALYVGFALATGLTSGIVSLAVGFIVGKAVVAGSQGVGGRRYQVLAVLLTYGAVSLSAVPLVLSQHLEQRAVRTQAADAGRATPAMSPARAVGIVVFLGLASPFLALGNPLQGLIGLVILFVGIRIAWRMTAARTLQIVGPIGVAAPTAAG